MSGEQSHPDAANIDSDRPWLKYRVGDNGDAGDRIVSIFQRSRQCIVFLNPDGNPQWEYHPSCVDAEASSTVAMALIIQVNTAVLRLGTKRRLFGIIADSLAYALDTRVANDTRDFFQSVRAAVEGAQREALHLTYLAASTAAAGVIAGTLLPLAVNLFAEPYRVFAICVAMACLGALVSVWLRFAKIPIQSYTSHLYTAIGGISRVVFGAFFGAAFLLLQRAGLVLTILNDEYALAAAALVAGFSERLIPELLASFESKLGGATIPHSQVASPAEGHAKND
jgi:hypothetical protein